MTQDQKASSADTLQCRRETSWSCLVLDGVDYQRTLEGQKAEPARTPISRVIIYLWQQWSLSKRGDAGRVKGEKDRSTVTSGDLKAHFTEIHQEIQTAGLRKPEETSNTPVWADPSGTWPLTVGTTPSSQATSAVLESMSTPPQLLPLCLQYTWKHHPDAAAGPAHWSLLCGWARPGVASWRTCTLIWQMYKLMRDARRFFVCFLSQQWSWLKFVCALLSAQLLFSLH